MSLVSEELQNALFPLFETGSEAEQALLWRVEQEPLLLFDAVTQDLLGQFPHINEAFPMSDNQIISMIEHLSGHSIAVETPNCTGPRATQIGFTSDNLGEPDA